MRRRSRPQRRRSRAATPRAPPPRRRRAPRASRSTATSRATTAAERRAVIAPRPRPDRRARSRSRRAARCGRRASASASPTQLWKPYLARSAACRRGDRRGVDDQAGTGGKPGTEHLAAEVAGGDAGAIGVAQPLHLAGVAGGEEVVAAAVLGEPHRRLDRRAVLAEGREVEVAGALQRIGHCAGIVEQPPPRRRYDGAWRKRWGRLSSRSGSTSGGPTSRRWRSTRAAASCDATGVSTPAVGREPLIARRPDGRASPRRRGRAVDRPLLTRSRRPRRALDRVDAGAHGGGAGPGLDRALSLRRGRCGS